MANDSPGVGTKSSAGVDGEWRTNSEGLWIAEKDSAKIATIGWGKAVISSSLSHLRLVLKPQRWTAAKGFGIDLPAGAERPCLVRGPGRLSQALIRVRIVPPFPKKHPPGRNFLPADRGWLPRTAGEEPLRKPGA